MLTRPTSVSAKILAKILAQILAKMLAKILAQILAQILAKILAAAKIEKIHPKQKTPIYSWSQSSARSRMAEANDEIVPDLIAKIQASTLSAAKTGTKVRK